MVEHAPDTETPIDRAHRAQAADPGDEAARLALYERLLDAELFLLLETEPAGDRLDPQVFEIEEGRYVLAFDRDDRLAGFVDAPAPYAALSGRRIVAMLAGQATGIGLNLGPNPSATLLTAELVAWLAAMEAPRPEARVSALGRIGPPRDLSAALLAALEPKLAAMAGWIGEAILMQVAHRDGSEGLMLALLSVPEAALGPVASALAEAMRFAPPGAGPLDVSFLEPDDPRAVGLRAVGLVIALPRPSPEVAAPVQVPGGDPDRPPILR